MLHDFSLIASYHVNAVPAGVEAARKYVNNRKVHYLRLLSLLITLLYYSGQ